MENITSLCFTLSVSIPFPQAMLRALIAEPQANALLLGPQQKMSMVWGCREQRDKRQNLGTDHPAVRTLLSLFFSSPFGGVHVHAHVGTHTYAHTGSTEKHSSVTDSGQLSAGSYQDLPLKLRGMIKFQTGQEFLLGFQDASSEFTRSFYQSRDL